MYSPLCVRCLSGFEDLSDHDICKTIYNRLTGYTGSHAKSSRTFSQARVSLGFQQRHGLHAGRHLRGFFFGGDGSLGVLLLLCGLEIRRCALQASRLVLPFYPRPGLMHLEAIVNAFLGT
jgi:hypothetical protein